MSTLKVILLEAKNIPKMDTIGWADPYVLLQVEGEELKRSKTKTIKKGEDPIYDERFEFKLKNQNEQNLHILIKDHDALTSDDEVGKVVLPLKPLQKGVAYLQWFELKPAKGVKCQGTAVRLILEIV